MQEFPARLKVIRLMIEYGIGVTEDGKVAIGPIEIPDTSIAKAAGVDRRVVRKTVEQILSDENLKRIFTGIKPAGAFLARATHHCLQSKPAPSSPFTAHRGTSGFKPPHCSGHSQEAENASGLLQCQFVWRPPCPFSPTGTGEFPPRPESHHRRRPSR